MDADVVKKRREFLFVDLFDSDDFESGRLSVSIDCPRVDELPYRFGQLQRESLFFKASQFSASVYRNGPWQIVAHCGVLRGCSLGSKLVAALLSCRSRLRPFGSTRERFRLSPRRHRAMRGFVFKAAN